MCVERIPSSLSTASTTAAPAPSPNRIQVLRSVQSTMRDNTSAPITSTFFAVPVRIYLSAMERPYTKPEHAAEISKTAALTAPISCWTIQEVAGKGKSGVTVPRTIISSSVASMPAMSRARREASTAKVEVNSPSTAIRRCLIPVLDVIHSSLVSTIRSRSRLVRIFSGKAEPVPVILALSTLSPLRYSLNFLIISLTIDYGIFRQFFGNMFGDTTSGILMSKADGIFDSFDIGTTVTNHANAINSQERGPAIFSIIYDLFKTVKGTANKQIP